MQINGENYRVSGVSRNTGENTINVVLLSDKLNKPAIVITFEDKSELKKILGKTWKIASFI